MVWIAQAIAWVINFGVQFNNTLNSIKGTINGAFANAGQWLFSIGQNIIQGLINGVKSMIGSIGSTVGNVAKGAVDTVKNLLGIHSPSKVFTEIGMNVTAGLAQGITGNTDMAVQATKQVTGQVIQAGAVSTASSTITTTNGSTYNFQPGSVVLSTAESVNTFFSIGNRSTALELRGLSPLSGTTGV